MEKNVNNITSSRQSTELLKTVDKKSGEQYSQKTLKETMRNFSLNAKKLGVFLQEREEALVQ